MKLLISPASMEEVMSIIESGADIIDIKNVKEGSLGAQFPWVIKEVVDYIHQYDIAASATLGDLPFKPGTVGQVRAFAAATLGVDYIKAGLYGLNTYDQAVEMLSSIHRSVRMVSEEALVVASGYADYRRFNGLSTWDLAQAARDTNCDVVMVDTAIKDGRNLFDALTVDEMKDFIRMGHEGGMVVALAGSIVQEHAPILKEINPDVIGVRGAVCGGPTRHSAISVEKTKEFIKLFQEDGVHA